MQTLQAQATETDQSRLKFPDAIAKGFFLPFQALRPQTNLVGTSDWKRLKAIEISQKQSKVDKFPKALAKSLLFLLKRSELRQTLPTQATETNQNRSKVDNFPGCDSEGFFPSF